MMNADDEPDHQDGVKSGLLLEEVDVVVSGV
jgi:hypothetical protein